MRTLALLLALTAACAAVRPAPAALRQRVVTVRLVGAWRSDQLAAVDRGLAAWLPAGVRHVRVRGPVADVDLVYAEFATCALAGAWVAATHEALIDAACTPGGYTGLSSVVGHELGHALGLRHRCRYEGEEAGCDLPTAAALMNPLVSYGALPPDFDHAVGPDDITDHATDADVAAYRARRPRPR